MKLTAQQLKNKIKPILGKNHNDPAMLVSILQDTQTELGYLPRKALAEIHKELNIPLTQVYGVATFFKAFSLEPRGRHQIQVCMGTACHVRGAEKILDTVERELGIMPGENDKDLRFSLETVNCVGACALGPIVIVDGDYAGEMKIDKVKPLLKNYK
ncbi:MAG: NAD(P)H-dependent oxidoreductase subunit E [Dehalococcoidia bacterium]|nr:NAD(P)H-dependent oxidoreductase subunit E [Dehalococcoidia bacterium]